MHRKNVERWLVKKSYERDNERGRDDETEN